MLQYPLPKNITQAKKRFAPVPWRREYADNGLPQQGKGPDDYANDPNVRPFLYEVPELMRLKDELNAKKRSLDSITDHKKLSRIVETTRGFSKLLGRHGILCTQYGAEIATNAWAKEAEEVQTFVVPYFFGPGCAPIDRFLSGKVAEAPGNFLLADNHMLSSKTDVSWLANSFIGAGSSNEGYLGDTYGLMRRYRGNWVYGADGDGDITSPANIRTFRQVMLDRFKEVAGRSPSGCDGKVTYRRLHLFTSDVKYVISGEYDEEERMNIPVQTGAIICALATLARGGIAILKHFSLFEGASVALLQLLCDNFREVVITKPETSRAGNSEVYVVCVDFLDKKIDIEGLYSYLEYIRYMNNGKKVPALYAECDEALVSAVANIGRRLVDRQKDAITSMLAMYERYKNKLREMETEYDAIGNKISRKWIERYQIPVMDPAKKMMK